MTMRTYWCVLFQAEEKRSGEVVFTEADNSGMHLGLDLDGDRESQLWAAMATAVQQAGGNVSRLDWYRMDLYDSDGDLVEGRWTVAAPGAAWPPSEGLADWTGDQLLGEIARRLRDR